MQRFARCAVGKHLHNADVSSHVGSTNLAARKDFWSWRGARAMNYSFSTVTRSVSFFMLAGVGKICGSWLIWRWLPDGKPGWWGFAGGLVLVLYGVIPTFQPVHFGRVYALYGEFFIVLSLLWGWRLDSNVPDRFDAFGAVIALAGVC